MRYFFTVLYLILISHSVRAQHPNLVITVQDVNQMRDAVANPGRFAQGYAELKQRVEAQILQPIEVPLPKDGGGGYTHERHKKNYQLMFDAGLIYQISQEQKYAQYVTRMLLTYAELYPSLPLHPKRKVKSQNPGKFFWQSLNEAVWLVYTIQAYDLIYQSLTAEQKNTIERQLLRPVAMFLSEGQPSTFNKVHNHGTWATAGVGMAGYVLKEPEWVEKALYDLNKSGKGGFLKQLEQLFSPQGYYNEGPYYQRYALFPFVTFAKAIENNEPEREIFNYRDGVLLKAIDTTIQLSYNGLFFPINDAIKSKGIDTIELVHAVAIAYGLTEQASYLDIAQQQQQIIVSGDGLKVAQDLDKELAQPYRFKSVAYGDGSDGQQGALVLMRGQQKHSPTVLFKPAAQGLGHGHFDKLTWQFYEQGNEIVSDYGAARFLNVEAKFGGRYLPENETYAKQTVAHNTLVVDEQSHFDGQVEIGNANAPTLKFFESSSFGTVASGEIGTAYQDVNMQRTLALVNLPKQESALVIDLLEADSDNPHQYDLPLHYQGQLIDTNFNLKSNSKILQPVGESNGYQHLWNKAQAKPSSGLAQVTWLNDNGRFYTLSSPTAGQESFIFTQLGANDPDFNLRSEQGFIRRAKNAKTHKFISVLEPHGEYNPSKEYTLQANSQITDAVHSQLKQMELVEISTTNNTYLVVINRAEKILNQTVTYKNKTFSINGRLAVYELELSEFDNEDAKRKRTFYFR